MYSVLISWLASAILAVVGVLFLADRRPASWANDACSTIINTGAALPTLPYRWPNGQGNTEKFIHGKQNSIKWRKQYGPIYRIWSGMKSEVVLTKPEHIQAVFKDSDKHTKALDNNSGYLFGQLLGECQGLINHEAWRCVRSVTEPAFTHNRTSTYTSLVVDAVSSHFESLAACKSTTDIIDPTQDFRMLPFWIIATIIYGKLDDSMKAKLSCLVPLREALFRKALHGGIVRFNWSRLLPTVENYELASFKKAWAEFNAQAYKMAIAQDRRDLPIVTMFDQIASHGCTEEMLLQTIDEMLFANLDVTLGGLTWAFVQLAAHPEVQENIRDEAKRAKSPFQEMTTYLNSTDSYLHAMILESSRLRPLAAFTVPQSASSTRVLDGWAIPAGTDFIVDAYVLNQLDDFWGADGLIFRPERFQKLQLTKTRYNFWRFGFGPRQCMGRYVTDLIIRAVLMELVRVFEISLLDQGQEWKRVDETWISHPDLKLKCIKRG